MLALEYPQFQIEILKEIDLVAEEIKSEVKETCNGRFDSVMGLLDSWQKMHDEWKKQYSLEMSENTRLSKLAVDGINDLKNSLPGTIAVEEVVTKSVVAIGWAGNRIGDFGEWGQRAFLGLVAIASFGVFLVACYKGGTSFPDIWDFLAQAWRK